MTPPPLPAQPIKKKSGCLKLILITFAVFVVLLVMGAIFQKQSEADWEKNKAGLMVQLQLAVDEGRARDALALVRDYKTVKDEKLQKLIREAEGLLREQRKQELAKRDLASEIARTKKAEESAKLDKERKLEQATKAKKLAEVEASKPLDEKIKEKLHSNLGSKESLVVGEKKWGALRYADYDVDQKLATVSFDSTSGAKYLVYDTISTVIETLFKFKEVDKVSVRAFTEYMDDNGNVVLLPWIDVKLTREAAANANWKNLRDYDKVKEFLVKKGEVEVRGE